MINEQRRRAYLSAMQVDSWLPAQVLPFAAASRAALLQDIEPLQVSVTTAPAAASEVSVAVAPLSAIQQVRAGLEQLPEPAVAAAEASAQPVAASLPKTVTVAAPRFSLQLYHAGSCLLLVELTTGEAFQSRDPAYLLLKDLLRAAGLPDSPQLLGEPVKWPLLAGSNLDQGPAAAREFLHGFLAARIEDEPGCACLWLIGLPALRYAGAVEADMYNLELQIEGLGPAWAVPGLELLMDEPQRKAALWQAMRRLMPRWKTVNA